MRDCLMSSTSDWVVDGKTCCPHPTDITSSSYLVTMWGLLRPPRRITTSASTGATETKRLKLWTVPVALLLMGKKQMLHAVLQTA